MGEAATGRQLLAILRADIQDSTSTLTSEGVAAALEERRRLKEIVSAEAERTGGRVELSEGDAVVAAWRSTNPAVSAALDIVDAVATETFDVRVAMTIGELPAPDTATGALGRVAGVERSAPIGCVTIDDRIRRAVSARSDVQARALPEPGLFLIDTAGRPSTETDLRASMLVTFRGPASPVRDAARHTELVCRRWGGEVIDGHRNGHLVVFESCTAAIEAAQAVHTFTAGLNLQIDAADAIGTSIAIAVGEVSTSSADRFGKPIVEAARLLSHATDASVVTADVRSIGSATPAANFMAGHASVHLKGFDEPVTIHHLEPAGPAPVLALPQSLAREPRFAFVGRRRNLDMLESDWRRVVAGEASSVVVLGEEGSGKSRLARELALRVFDEGGCVLIGSCDEDLSVPYLPIADALQPLSAIDPMVETALVEGSGVLTTLFSRSPDTPAATASAVDRLELFGSVTATLRRAADRRPVLLVIDDVQWANADTMQMLEHVLADPSSRRLMVVITCRVENLADDDPARAFLASTRMLNRPKTIRLDRLGNDDIVKLLETETGRALQDNEISFADQISTATGGSPLFVEELLVHLNATGVLVHDGSWQLAVDIEKIPVPASIVEVMAHRLRRLGPEAESVLAVAATIGKSFDPELVGLVSEREIETVLDVVDAATAARLVSDDDTAPTCTFNDEITRAAALMKLSPLRRRRVHRAIAEALEARGNMRVDALAHHWREAAGDDGLRRAVHYAKLAARRDMASAAWTSAIERLRQVLELLDRLGEHDDRPRGEAHYLLGACLRMVGDEAHRPDLIRAAASARRLRDGELLAQCAIATMRPGSWYPEAGVVDDDICGMCEDALDLLAADAPIRARVLAALAINLSYHPDAKRRWDLVREAQTIATCSGDPALEGAALAAELIACREPDQFERRYEIARKVARIGRSIGDRNLIFTGELFQLLEHLARGEIKTAERMAGHVRTLADELGAFWPRFLAGHFPVLFAVARCDPKARMLIAAAVGEFESHPVDSFGLSVIQSAILAMAEGTLADMLRPFSETVDQFSEYPEWVQKWNLPIAAAHVESGAVEKAIDAIEAQPNPTYDRDWIASLCQLGHLGWSLGRPDYCAKVLDSLTPYRGRLAIVGLGATLTGQVSTALGQASLGLGDLDAAEMYLREAAAQAAAVGFPYFEATALRFLATVLLRRDPESIEAHGLIDQVEAAAARYDFAVEAEAAAALKADYPAPIW